jgi:hypothetical protein
MAAAASALPSNLAVAGVLLNTSSCFVDLGIGRSFVGVAPNRFSSCDCPCPDSEISFFRVPQHQLAGGPDQAERKGQPRELKRRLPLHHFLFPHLVFRGRFTRSRNVSLPADQAVNIVADVPVRRRPRVNGILTGIFFQARRREHISTR